MTQSANDHDPREEQRTRSFNPNEHILKLKSKDGPKDYLPVQWRLVWFREQCPHGTIDTEELGVDLDREMEEEANTWNSETRRSEKVTKRAKGYARYRAVVTDGKGGRSTGTKSESAVSFPDFIEKAETGAIGRALAALGYGTQFTGEELDEAHRIVDAPVGRSAPSYEENENANKHISSVRPIVANNNGHSATTSSDDKSTADAPVTEQQLASLRKLCQHLGQPEPEKPETMSYLNAKALIARLSHEYNERKMQSKKSA